MSKRQGRPPKLPGQALTEVMCIKVSYETKNFYEKYAGLMHTKEIGAHTVARAVLDNYRYQIEEADQNRAIAEMNEHLSGNTTKKKEK